MDRFWARVILAAAVVLVPLPCALRAQQAGDNVPTPAIVEAKPADGDAYLTKPPTEGIADVLMARGRYLAAIRVYEQLPPTALILNKMGIACEHMMMFDRARASFTQALKMDAKYAEAYNNMGTLLHSQGDLRNAEKMYRKSLKLKPKDANTLKNLGTLYYALGKFKQGDRSYREALVADPAILEHSGQGIQANAKVNSASEIHYHMAATYALAGSQKLALQFLRQAIGEGFKDRNRLLHDKEFADLRTSETFLAMVDDLKKD